MLFHQFDSLAYAKNLCLLNLVEPAEPAYGDTRLHCYAAKRIALLNLPIFGKILLCIYLVLERGCSEAVEGVFYLSGFKVNQIVGVEGKAKVS